MPAGRVRRSLSAVAHKAGLLPHVQALRGRTLRAVRSCRSCLSNSHEQLGEMIPSRLCKMSAEDLPTWFGYYDKTPFSHDNSRILAAAMTCTRDWSKQTARFPLKVGCFDWADVAGGNPVFHQFAATETWSWQQGCMLQWFPGDPNRLVLYNKLVDGQYGSVIQDVFNHSILTSYRMPIYAVDPAGRWGVSLDFSRLERLRPGYGYVNHPDKTAESLCPEDDGLWLMDLRSGHQRMLVTVRQLARHVPQPSMETAAHYINVPLFSLDGSRIVFLHLWLSDGSRRNRLMCYDLADASLRVLDDAATISHFNWMSNDELLCFRSPFQGSAAYYIYKLPRGRDPECVPCETMEVLMDGHPSMSPKGDWVVTDSYPDRMGEQSLCVCSLQERTVTEVGRFYSAYRYRGAVRCDLHPRWDNQGKRICFDSTHQGRRAMYVFDADLVH